MIERRVFPVIVTGEAIGIALVRSAFMTISTTHVGVMGPQRPTGLRMIECCWLRFALASMTGFAPIIGPVTGGAGLVVFSPLY